MVANYRTRHKLTKWTRKRKAEEADDSELVGTFDNSEDSDQSLSEESLEKMEREGNRLCPKTSDQIEYAKKIMDSTRIRRQKLITQPNSDYTITKILDQWGLFRKIPWITVLQYTENLESFA